MLAKLKTSFQSLEGRKQKFFKLRPKPSAIRPLKSDLTELMLSTQDSFPQWLNSRKDFQAFVRNEGLYVDYIIRAITKPFIFRSEIEQNSIINWLSLCPFTKSLQTQDLQELSKIVYSKYFYKSQSLMIETEKAEEMYLILKGKVAIWKNGIKTVVLGERNSVGEYALESGETRCASVVALTDVIVLTINAHSFKTLLSEKKTSEKDQITKFFRTVPSFANIYPSKIQYLARKVITSCYNLNDVIYSQGEPSIGFFIIKEGLIELQKLISLTKKNNLPISQTLISTKQYAYSYRTLKEGDIFGTCEATEGSPRISTAICKSENCIVYCCNSQYFSEIFSASDMISLREKNVESKELKRRLDKTLTLNLKRIKTLTNITESSLWSGTLSERKALKKRTWLEGLHRSSQILPSTRLVKEKIEFQPRFSK